jgi:hypothetical protein
VDFSASLVPILRKDSESFPEIERLRQLIRLQQQQINLQDVEIAELKRIATALIDQSHGRDARITELENLLRGRK